MNCRTSSASEKRVYVCVPEFEMFLSMAAQRKFNPIPGFSMFISVFYFCFNLIEQNAIIKQMYGVLLLTQAERWKTGSVWETCLEAVIIVDQIIQKYQI